MSATALAPDWVGRIARREVDTRTIDRPTARALIRHNLAVAVAELIRPGAEPSACEQLLIDERTWRVMQMMKVVAAFTQVSRALEAKGVAHLLIKGPALAVQTTGHWAGRNSCDVDLLIDPVDCARVHEVFTEVGLSRRDGRNGPAGAFSRWAICEVGYHGTLANIDLHWRLDPSPTIFAAAFSELWRRSEPVEIEGRSCATLGRLDAWLFTAVHGARSDWIHWSMLLDAVRQAGRLSAAERAEARVLAAREGCGALLAVAEALVVRCGLQDVDRAPEGWAVARADRILASTAAGEGPKLSVPAALSRRIELARSSSGLGGGLGSLARSMGRVILNPGHYKEHLLSSLRLKR